MPTSSVAHAASSGPTPSVSPPMISAAGLGPVDRVVGTRGRCTGNNTPRQALPQLVQHPSVERDQRHSKMRAHPGANHFRVPGVDRLRGEIDRVRLLLPAAARKSVPRLPGSRSRSSTSASGAGSSGLGVRLGNGKTARIPCGVCTSLSRSKSPGSTIARANSSRTMRDLAATPAHPCRTRSRRGMAPASSASWTARYPSTTNAPSAARRSRRASERTRAMAGLAAEVMTSFEGVSLRSGGATSFRGCRLRLRGSRFA